MARTFVAVPVRAFDGIEHEMEVVWCFDSHSAALEVWHGGEIVASEVYPSPLGFSEADSEIRRLVTKFFRSWEREPEDAEAFSETIVLGNAEILNAA